MLADVQHAITLDPAGTRLVFLSDYDGTLADFTMIRPFRGRPRTHARAALLAGGSRRSLVRASSAAAASPICGRARSCRARVYLAGLHGMEIEVGQRRWQHPDLEAAREDVRELNARLEDVRQRVPGLMLEDKHASVAVHVRGVDPERRGSALALADACAAEWVASGELRRLDRQSGARVPAEHRLPQGRRDALDCATMSRARAARRRGSCSSETMSPTRMRSWRSIAASACSSDRATARPTTSSAALREVNASSRGSRANDNGGGSA